MRTISLPVLILCFAAFLGLIFSHSISFSGTNYVPYNYQAFGAEDNREDDSSSDDSTSSGDSSSSDDSRSSSDDSLASPNNGITETPAIDTPPPATEDTGSNTPPPATDGYNADIGTGIGFISFSPTNLSDNKEGDSTGQSVLVASAQTDRSNEDGFQQGVKDANRDLKGLNGHGPDDSCPNGHTATFCEGYKQGYHESWYDTGEPRYDSQPPTKLTSSKPPQNGPDSGSGTGSRTPNIKIVDNREQQKVIVKVKTKVDTVTKNVIVNNIVTAPSQAKQPTFLQLLDTAQLCQLAGDTQCVAKQNQ